MGKLLKTFWLDNRKILAILTAVIAGAAFIFPVLVIVVSSRITANSYTDPQDVYSGILLFMYFLSIFLLSTLFTNGFGLFLALRTLTGTAKTRYALITTSRVTRSFFAFLIYVAGYFIFFLLLTSIAALLSVIVSAVVPGTPFIFTTFQKIMSDFFDVFEILSFGKNIIVTFFTTLVSPYFFWQLIFLLPQTKRLRSLPKVGSVFTIIGIFAGLYIIQFFFSVYFMVNYSYGAVGSAINFASFITPICYLGLYFYSYIKELEL